MYIRGRRGRLLWPFFLGPAEKSNQLLPVSNFLWRFILLLLPNELKDVNFYVLRSFPNFFTPTQLPTLYREDVHPCLENASRTWSCSTHTSFSGRVEYKFFHQLSVILWPVNCCFTLLTKSRLTRTFIY